MEKKQNGYDYIVTPYPEKVARFLHLPYPVIWLGFSGILFLLHIGGYYCNQVPPYAIGTALIFSMLSALVALAIIWCSKALENFTPAILLFIDWPNDKLLKWYESELKAIFRSGWMCFVGIVVVVMVMLAIMSTTFWGGLESVSKITFSLIIVSVCFLGGGLLYNMVRIAKMVIKIGKIEEIKVSIYQHPLTSIKAIGNLLGKIATAIIGIYFIGVIGVFIEPELKCGEMIIVVAFFGVVVLTFFLYPQFEIHKIMSKVKHMRLRRFSSHLEDCLENVTNDPSQERVMRVRELFEIQKSLNGMSEWPFDTRLLIAILTGIAIPIIVALLQVCFKSGAVPGN